MDKSVLHNMKTYFEKRKSGFTLVELMVATSIFVVIMLVSMSALMIIMNSAKGARALRVSMDNVNFAMESMTRSIRMGTYYDCVSTGGTMPSDSDTTTYADCPNGGTLIAFVPQKPSSSNRVGYKLAARNDAGGTHSLQRCDANGCVDIVSNDVDLTHLNFIVKGSAPLSLPDTTQASVYITMKGTVMVKGVPTSFAIQTLASQRNY